MTSVGREEEISKEHGDMNDDGSLANGLASVEINELPTSPGLAKKDCDETQKLLSALYRLSNATDRKANIRSTQHVVRLQGASEALTNGEGHAATIEEAADDEQPAARTPSQVSNNEIVLTSWKTNEFAYRKTTKIGYSEQDELPTLARGLFTCRSKGGKERIVVRGYDKFFNEGEMPWTKPRAIETYSTAPYELSFKENGCIIFIAALTETQLLVTSKHSLGSREGDRLTHAQMGEQWLDKHLASVGRTKTDLAQELWARNETAVAELCDDNFEEHVLAYPPERTGLHLHGLNKNTPQFQTRLMREVEAFAKEWGFLPTRYIEMAALADVDKFCQRVAETGSWQGTPIEGFVVRTRMPQQFSTAEKSIVAPPYQPSQVWFYKVKFDEPYLMYRDWRELTRKMLAEKEKWDKTRESMCAGFNDASITDQRSSKTVPGTSADSDKSKSQAKKDAKKLAAALAREEAAKRAADAAAGLVPPDPPQTRSKRPETKLFVIWCHERLYGSIDGKIKPQSAIFEGFAMNQGIIGIRERFLTYLRSDEGQKRLQRFERAANDQANGAQQTPGDSSGIPFTRTVIVPVAVPGCGKSIVGIALQQLLRGMAHTQSDDVTTKKTGPTFLKNVQVELDTHEIVFADRNNHLFKHRNEVADAVREWERNGTSAPTTKKSKGKQNDADAKKTPQRVRLVALAWTLDALPLNAIHHICSDRITSRGDNHQSLRLTEEREHEQILWQFLRDLEPFGSVEQGAGDAGYGDAAFDRVVNIELNASLEQTVTEAVRGLANVLGTISPDQDAITKAIDFARQYRVSVKKEGRALPTRPVRYYALALELDVKKVIGDALKADAEAHAAFERLVNVQRLNEKPHVTLVHGTELKTPDDSTSKGRKDVAVAQKQWDTYAAQSKLAPPAIFTVEIDYVAWDDRAMALSVCVVHSTSFGSLADMQGAQWRPHVTLGTFAEDIRPYEGNRVIQDADKGSTSVRCHRFRQALHVQGRIKGLS